LWQFADGRAQTCDLFQQRTFVLLETCNLLLKQIEHPGFLPLINQDIGPGALNPIMSPNDSVVTGQEGNPDYHRDNQ
jgi:hypothetical protein